MTSISEYTFNNIGRIGADKNDNPSAIFQIQNI